MKRFLTVIALVLMLALTMSVFAACAGNETPTEAPTTETPTEAPATNKVTVSYWLGSKLLKEVKIDKGAKAENWTPEQDGAEFDGWYAEASLAEKFDFDKAINEDTDIFAKFKSNEYVEDETEYYVIGGGSGDLAASNWNHEDSYANLLMEKDESITNANVYTITLKMYAGDRFQICYDLSWNGQQGIGYIPGAEYCDGINPNDKNEYTAADMKVAQVKNENGEVVFIGGDEYNKTFDVWNIILNEGQDGIYKFTLTTYPGQTSFNTIEWELVEKIEAQEKTHDMYLVGSFNGWNAADEEETFHLAESQDGKTWTGVLTVAEDSEFKVVNHIGTIWIGDSNNGGGNFAVSAGTYGIRYTVETDAVEIMPLDYYLVGTFVGEDGTVVNFAVKDGITPKLVNGTVTFNVKDVTGVKDFDWLANQGKGIMAIKVVYGCELVIKDWYGNGEDNFYFDAEGNYTVTFADGVVTVAPATDDGGNEDPEGPQVGVAYKGEVVQKNLGQTLYFNGQTGNFAWYLATTETKADGVDLYLEAVEGVDGGYRLYFMSGAVKKYIRVYERTDGEAGMGKGSMELTTEVPDEYLTYDAAANTLIYTADADNSYYIGSYNSFDTLSVSNTSYITGDNAANVDATQFPLRLV